MAERRMFAKTIIDSDAFLDLPQSTQLLYFHLSMRADDDGFVNNPKSIVRMINASDDDLKLLATKKFIIGFADGTCVIKHWKINNYIRKDAYTPTKYKENKALLEFDENDSYRLCHDVVTELSHDCDETVTDMSRCRDDSLTQDRIGKVSKGKNINNSQIESEFESLWEIYPRKQGKEKAKACYVKAKKDGVTFDEVKAGIDAYVNYIRREKVEKRYIKQGSTFFSQQAWKDDWGTGQSQTYDFKALERMIDENT